MAQNNLGAVPVQIAAPSLTSGEILFIQSLASESSYASSNVVLMNRNNGGSPLQILRVKSDGSGLEWASSAGGVGGSGTTNYIPKWTATTTLGNSIIYDDGTRVGIDTSNPNYTLHVNGDAFIDSGLLINTGFLVINPPASPPPYMFYVGGDGYFGNDVIMNEDLNVMQNLTVGTNNIYERLTVAGNIGISADANSFIGTLDNYSLSLRTNNLDRIYITNNGDVGIGTTSPQHKLDVNGNIRVSGNTILNSVQYSWPSSDGSNEQVLTTNGSGTLSWTTVVRETATQTLSNKNILTSSNTQTGTSYTLVLSDAGKIVLMNNASANTLTIPTNASVAFPIGTKVMITQYGAGSTTIQGDTGVTLRNPNSVDPVINEQYASRVILKINTNEWLLV